MAQAGTRRGEAEQAASERSTATAIAPVAGAAPNGAVARVAAIDPRLARAIRSGRAPVGNRATARILARTPPTAEAAAEKEEPLVKGKVQFPPNQYEVAWKWKKGTTKSISIKVTFARSKDTKLATAGVGKDSAKASLSLFEQKAVREKCAGEVGKKVQASLAQFEAGAQPLLPGLTFKFKTQALEYQFDRVKKESDLNLLTVSGIVEGDVTTAAQEIADIPADQRSRQKITVSGEFKWTPSAGDLARLKDIWKANKTMEAESKAIKEATDKLEDVDAQRKAAAKRMKDLRKEADELRRQANRAKRPAVKKRLMKQVKQVEGRLAKVAERDRELKQAGDKLADAIKKSTKNLDEAAAKSAKAASGMKGRFGKAVAKQMAKHSAKFIGRMLAKAIPIVNIASTIYDLVEIASQLDKFRRGAKWDPFGGGDEGEGQGAGEGGPGTAADGGVPGGPDGGVPGGPDGGAPGATDGGAPGATDGGAPAGTGGPGGAGGTPAPGPAADGGTTAPGPTVDGGTPAPGPTADGGTGPAADGGAPATEPAAPPQPELHEQAKAVYELVKGKDVKLEPEHSRLLDSTVPKGLTPEQLAELGRRLDKLKGEGVTDPYEIIGRIHEEIDRVVRGEPPTEVFIDGKRQQDQSEPGVAPAVPDVDKTKKAKKKKKTKEAKGPKGPKAKRPAEATAPAPAAADKPKTKAEPPKSLMPNLPSGIFNWDASQSEWVLSDAKRQELLDTNFDVGGGLIVVINDVQLSHQKSADYTLVTLSFELMVFDIPAGAGPGYPWKIGDTRFHSERHARDLKTGEILGVEEEASGQQAFVDALQFSGGKFTLKAKGTTVDWTGAKLRIDDLADSGTHRGSDDDKDYYSVGFLVTPTAVSDPNAGVVTEDGPIRFEQGKQVVVRVQITIPKQKSSGG